MEESINIGEAELAGVVAGAGPGRRIVAIAGAPASGKSTCADRLVAALNADVPGLASVLPMDGYHFDDAVLNARGLRSRKGSPETFDVPALRFMLERLKGDAEDEVAVPVFDRDLEISRAAARIITRSTRTIVVEGNYLLLNHAPWTALQPFFDVTVRISVTRDVRRDRLIRRWDAYGLPAEEVRMKVEANDLPNGDLVESQSVAAQFLIHG